MLIGLTWAVPRVTRRCSWKSTGGAGCPIASAVVRRGMPRSSAAWMTFWGPSSIESTMSTNAVLMEFSVASISRHGRAVVGVALVAELGAGDVDRAVALEGVVEREAVADGRDVGGGLHRRAGHAAGDRPVDLGLQVVLAAVEAEQLAGGGVDGGGADVQVLVAGSRAAGVGAARRTASSTSAITFGSNVVVMRRPPPSISSSVSRCPASSSCLTSVEHVAPLAAELALRGDLGELRQPLQRLVALLGGDGPHLGHAVEDVGVAALEVLLGLLAVGRVVLRGVVEHGREHGGLAQVEVLGRRGRSRPRRRPGCRRRRGRSRWC